jgi:hypothetical protein
MSLPRETTKEKAFLRTIENQVSRSFGWPALDGKSVGTIARRT